MEKNVNDMEIQEILQELKDDTYPTICVDQRVTDKSFSLVVPDYAPPEIWAQLCQIANPGIFAKLRHDLVFQAYHPEFFKLVQLWLEFEEGSKYGTMTLESFRNQSTTTMGSNFEGLLYWLQTQHMKYVNKKFVCSVVINPAVHKDLRDLQPNDMAKFDRTIYSIGIGPRFAATLVGYQEKGKPVYLQNETDFPITMPSGQISVIHTDGLDVITAYNTQNILCRTPRWSLSENDPVFTNIVKAAISKTENIVVVITKPKHKQCLMHICTIWISEGIKVIKTVRVPYGIPNDILIHNMNIFLAYSLDNPKMTHYHYTGAQRPQGLFHYHVSRCTSPPIPFNSNHSINMFEGGVSPNPNNKAVKIFHGDVYSITPWFDANQHKDYMSQFNVAVGLANRGFYRLPIVFSIFEPPEFNPLTIHEIKPMISYFTSQDCNMPLESETKTETIRNLMKIGDQHDVDFNIVATTETSILIHRTCSLQPELNVQIVLPTNTTCIAVETFGTLFLAYMNDNTIALGNLADGTLINVTNTEEVTKNQEVGRFYQAIHLNSERCIVLLSTGDIFCMVLNRGVTADFHNQF